ncbi:hypothetical protein CAURIS_06180 [Corynebacterium auris]|nr:hypothetical protein CAURIS_06180 [Corynebacterium auris]
MGFGQLADPVGKLAQELYYDTMEETWPFHS